MPFYTLNVVKSIQNYGIVVNGSTYDPAFTKGYINASPNISISGSTCFIDYSDVQNLSDLNFISKVFAAAPSGTTYSLSNGDYYDQDKNIRRDVSGVFSLSSLINGNKIIVGTIVSGLTYTNNYSFYGKNNFVAAPQYTTSYAGGATARNYIINNLTNNPNKSFVNLGIVGSGFNQEEYVELNGSTSNTGKLKVNSVLQLKDNKELIYTDTALTDENLQTVNVKVDHLIRGNSNPEIIAKNQKKLGCYVSYDSNGDQTACYENQNEYQAFLRQQGLTGNASGFWVPCSDCARLTDNAYNASNVDKSFTFESVIFLLVNEQSSVSFTPSNDLQIVYTYTLESNFNSIDTPAETSEITLGVDTGFKLDLSHPTLKGFAANIYVDSAKTILISSDYYPFGTPGYDQAGIIIRKTETSPKKLYLELSGNVTFNVEIVIE